MANAVEQYDNAGQVCLAGVRLLVESSVRDEFVERFVARAAALRQGDPRDLSTDIGPQISREHLERIDGFVQRARRRRRRGGDRRRHRTTSSVGSTTGRRCSPALGPDRRS